MRHGLVVFLITVSTLITINCTRESAPESPIASGTAEKAVDGYAYRLDLDDMQFYWSVEANSLKIKLSADTEGWVGVGFNPTEMMMGASFIIGFVKDGVVTVEDHHGHASRLHRQDVDMGGTDDFSDIGGSEKKGRTEITFRVPLKSADSLDKPINAAGDTKVLLAYGRTDRLVQQHVFRVRSVINFTTGKYSIFLEERTEVK